MLSLPRCVLRPDLVAVDALNGKAFVVFICSELFRVRCVLKRLRLDIPQRTRRARLPMEVQVCLSQYLALVFERA